MSENIDFHLNLKAGMNPKSYEKWAGFYIPGLSPKDNENLTILRIESENDVEKLFENSLEEAIKHNVNKVFGNLTLEFIKGFSNPRNLILLIQNIRKKYELKRLQSQYFLCIDSDNPENFKDTSVAAAFTLLGSGEFVGVCLKGSSFLKNIKLFDRYIYSVQKMNLKIKIDFSLFEDLKEIDDQILQKIMPNEIAGNSLFDADYFLANKTFISDHNIVVNFTPDNFRKAGTELLNRLKMLRDSGVDLRIGSGNFLYHCISVEEFNENLTS